MGYVFSLKGILQRKNPQPPSVLAFFVWGGGNTPTQRETFWTPQSHEALEDVFSSFKGGPPFFFVEPCLFFWGLWTRFILPKFQGDTPLEDPATTFKQIGSLLGFFLSIQGFNQWWFNFRFMSFFLRKTDLSSSGFINEVVKTNCTLPKTEQQKFLRINVALEDEISKFWSQYRPIFRDSSCWEGILWLGSNPIYSISKWLPYSVVTLW